jgi:phosphopantothenoylcysteine decarboxylase/phosphopantothenate--cysteine ligase
MATHAGERGAQSVKFFTTTEDLRAKLKSFSGKKVDAIFHAAAVSDFMFGKVFTEKSPGTFTALKASKKVSTRQGALLVELVPTPKIIAELRDWFPKAKIVGWKYEADGGRAEALRSAKKQITECNTDVCVANGPAYGRGFGVVTARSEKHLANKEKLFADLETSIE